MQRQQGRISGDGHGTIALGDHGPGTSFVITLTGRPPA